jgi:hypothetical protein
MACRGSQAAQMSKMNLGLLFQCALLLLVANHEDVGASQIKRATTYLDKLPDQLAYFGSSSSDNEDDSSENYKEEWRSISNNGTRRVFNFGIGSLTSYASRQRTVDPSMPDPPPSIAPAFPDKVHGIVRELQTCHHYAAASARPCLRHDSHECHIGVVGVFFEIFEEEWADFRKREHQYDLLEVNPTLPLRNGMDPTAYFFAWGTRGETPTCEWDKPVVSTAYWDYVIGGILAWDGQLLDTGRYTWDLVTELEMLDDMSSVVHQMPSLTLSERRRLAVEFVNSTKHSKFQWVDDRACPFTGDCIITPIDNLAPEALATGPTADAIGTVSPPFSDAFHAYVDEILIEGGWEYGARNSIHDRVDPCSEIDPILIDRYDWDDNPYYDDIVAFSKQILSDDN